MTRQLGPVAIVLLAVSMLGLTACGSDTPSRDDFVASIRRITNPPVDRALAGCAYDNLKGNERLLKLATTDSTIPAKDDSELSKILARCILTVGSTTTTGKPTSKTTSTTKSSKSSKSSTKKSSSKKSGG
jgi:hypothetical protein